MLQQEIERRDQIGFPQRAEELAQPAYLFSRFHQPYDKDTFGHFLKVYQQDTDYFDKFLKLFEFRIYLQNIGNLNFPL